MSWLTRVLFPDPAGPVMPTTSEPRLRPRRLETSPSPSGSPSSSNEIARATLRLSPAATRSKSGNVGISVAEQLPGDDESLDLARPFADGAELDVAEEFLGR